MRTQWDVSLGDEILPAAWCARRTVQKLMLWQCTMEWNSWTVLVIISVPGCLCSPGMVWGWGNWWCYMAQSSHVQPHALLKFPSSNSTHTSIWCQTCKHISRNISGIVTLTESLGSLKILIIEKERTGSTLQRSFNVPFPWNIYYLVENCHVILRKGHVEIYQPS